MAPILEYFPQPAWPALAWLAVMPRGGGVIDVLHGSRVETTPTWFGEIVWDGPFADGGFDRTEAVFGSGGRVRDEVLTLVSSLSTIDRLNVLDLGGHVLVSNSIVAVMTASGAAVDPFYAGFQPDFNTIELGLSDYKRFVRTDLGPVELVYARNLRWDGECLARVDKPVPTQPFTDFHAYRAYLRGAVHGIVANLASLDRRSPYEALNTLSNGYDSTAVTVLTREAGIRGAVYFPEGDDAGTENVERVADVLDLDLRIVSRFAYRQTSMPEVEILASGGLGYELQFRSIDEQVAGRVVFTAYHGDLSWATQYRTTDDFRSGAQSGLSLTEYRLHAGFINVTPPFLGARRHRELRAICDSDDMKPWRVDHEYDRPIARRLIEEAGVPRGTFGYRKQVGSVAARRRDNMSAESRASLHAFLTERLPGRLALRYRLTRTTLPIRHATERPLAQLGRLLGQGPAAVRWFAKGCRALALMAAQDADFAYAFPWAVMLLRPRYAVELRKVPAGSVERELAA